MDIATGCSTKLNGQEAAKEAYSQLTKVIGSPSSYPSQLLDFFI